MTTNDGGSGDADGDDDDVEVDTQHTCRLSCSGCRRSIPVRHSGCQESVGFLLVNGPYGL